MVLLKHNIDSILRQDKEQEREKEKGKGARINKVN